MVTKAVCLIMLREVRIHYVTLVCKSLLMQDDSARTYMQGAACMFSVLKVEEWFTKIAPEILQGTWPLSCKSTQVFHEYESKPFAWLSVFCASFVWCSDMSCESVCCTVTTSLDRGTRVLHSGIMGKLFLQYTCSYPARLTRYELVGC